MPKLTRKSTPLIVLITILLLGVVLFYLSGKQDKKFDEMLDRATLLTKLPCSKYGWVQDGTLWFWGNGATPSHLDLKTGVSAPIPGFPVNNTFRLTDAPEFSPDGKWFLNSQFNSGKWTAFSLTGGRKTWSTMPGIRGNSNCVWLSDSRRWLEYYFDGAGSCQYLIHSLEGKENSAKMKTTAFMYPVGTLPGERVLGAVNDQNGVEISQLDISTGRGKIGVFRLPSNAGINGSFAVSPQGDRVAWFVTEHHRITVMDEIRKLLFLPGNVDKTLLWTAKIDGSDRKLIGVSQKVNQPYLQDLKWTPDGKYLSFKAGFLCKIPAE